MSLDPPRRPTWLPPVDVSRERLRRVHHRWQRVVVLAGATGVLTGLAVVGFERLTLEVVLDWVRTLPTAVVVFVPGVGLVVAWLVLRYVGRRASPDIADAYLRDYHGRPDPSDARTVGARVTASAVTLGSGGAMGFEGPSIYMGATIGSWIQSRWRRFFTHADRHVLLVAGAAAGVAAIFKAPATGAVFALEVPYQQDTAAHAVVPALIGSAASYLVFIAINGTEPLLRVVGNPGFNTADLLGAVALGVVAGLGARGFAMLTRRCKQLQSLPRPLVRIVVSGLVLAGLAAIAVAAFDAPLTIGPGYQAITWSLDAGRATELVALLLVLETLAVLATVTGGGAGGLFIPLVTLGWLVGRVAEGLIGTGTSLFAVVGAAAFLGAGYRTPIAAVVFVAEASRGPGFIVPALIATAVSQLLMGRYSVSGAQFERRSDVPAP